MGPRIPSLLVFLPRFRTVFLPRFRTLHMALHQARLELLYSIFYSILLYSTLFYSIFYSIARITLLYSIARITVVCSSDSLTAQGKRGLLLILLYCPHHCGLLLILPYSTRKEAPSLLTSLSQSAPSLLTSLSESMIKLRVRVNDQTTSPSQ